MKHTLCQCGKRIMDAVEQPQLRREIHYECGLYKSKSDRAPVASVRINNDCAIPLIKVIAVIGIAVALVSAANAMANTVMRVFCRCKRKHDVIGCGSDRS